MPHQLELTISKRICLVVLPGFSIADLAAALETLRVANEIGGASLYGIAVFATGPRPTLSDEGIEIVAPSVLEDSGTPHAVLLVPPRTAAKWENEHPHLLQWLRCRAGEGVFVRTMGWSLHCPLGEDSRSPLEGRGRAKDSRRHCPRWATSPLGPLLELIDTDQGSAFALSVVDQLSEGGHRSDRGLREPAETSPRVATALRLMHANLEAPLRCSDVARRVGISARHLERLFRMYCGSSPRSHYLRVRLEYARTLVRHSTMTEHEVAIALGFSSITYFRRRYRQQFGVGAGEEKQASPPFASVEGSISPPLMN